LKNVTQFVAMVFAAPVRPAGTPEDEPADELDDEAGAEADGGAEVATGADVAEVVDELEPELPHAASTRQPTAATARRSDLTLERVYI
jgi:hypothetical protein